MFAHEKENWVNMEKCLLQDKRKYFLLEEVSSALDYFGSFSNYKKYTLER